MFKRSGDVIARLLRRMSGRGSASVAVSDVIEVAAALDTGEIAVFKLAYAQVYGHSAGGRTLGPHVLRYLFRQVVPPFVRQFTHKILEARRQGRSNRSGYCLPRRSGAVVLRSEDGEGLWLLVAAALLGLGALALAQVP